MITVYVLDRRGQMPPAHRDRPWCVQWRTSSMPAPAFWYFATHAEALREAEKLAFKHPNRQAEQEGA